DGLEREVAERARPIPALVPGLGRHAHRTRPRVELVPALEPDDAGDTVAGLAARLRVEEVRGERLHVVGAESEPLEARPRLVRMQSAPRASRDRRRSGAACGPDWPQPGARRPRGTACRCTSRSTRSTARGRSPAPPRARAG